MAEYHESFWVVVGTAAPVIALANAVTVERLTLRAFNDFSAPQRGRHVAAVIASMSLFLCVVLLAFTVVSLIWEADSVSAMWAGGVLCVVLFLCGTKSCQ